MPFLRDCHVAVVFACYQGAKNRIEWTPLRFLPPLRLTGATILRDGQMQARSLSFAEGRILRGPLPEVDLTGYLILPGIIDLHGDGFEHHLAPRPTAPVPLTTGLAAFDREAAAQGVTTAYLAQGWSWEGGPRSPDQAERLLAALDQVGPRALTDLRVQIRAETHLVGQTDRLIAAVERHRVGFVVFNDHLDEGVLLSRQSPARFEHWARRIGQAPEDLMAAISAAQAAAPGVPRSLCRLGEAFDRLGVIYGSHDDPDAATRERFRMLGAAVAEFPLTLSAASAARAMSSPVLMGAPNVVRGASQAGNASAMDMILDGTCDGLVSDYHLPSLALAAWALVDRGAMTLPQAWAMISTRPAEILRLADRGRLDPGRRADLVVVNAASRAVEATIAGGRLAYLSGEAGRRFLAQGRVVDGLNQSLPLAAE